MEPNLPLITEEHFYALYPEHPELWDLLTSRPTTEYELRKFYLTSKIWRLNNLYTIINKAGEHVKFSMNLAQYKVYANLLMHPRLLILKSRQQGISTFWLLDFFDDAILIVTFLLG